MKFSKVIFFVFLFTHEAAHSQPVESIKLRKNGASVYFFQKGLKKDTITAGVADLFYFIAGDSAKAHLSIWVENGRLVRSENDSLLKFEYLPGLKYETIFSHSLGTGNAFITKSLINGSTDRDRRQVVIRIYDRKEEKFILENTFYYGH